MFLFWWYIYIIGRCIEEQREKNRKTEGGKRVEKIEKRGGVRSLGRETKKVGKMRERGKERGRGEEVKSIIGNENT